MDITCRPAQNGQMQLGADVEGLDRVAKTFDTAARQIERVGPEVTSSLQLTEWKGQDRQQFESDLKTRIIPQTRRISGELKSLGEAMRRQADQQRRASESMGGSGGFVPGLPGLPGLPGTPLPSIDDIVDWFQSIDWKDLAQKGWERIVKPVLTALKFKTLFQLLQAGSLATFLATGGTFGILQKFIGAGGARAFGAVTGFISVGLDIWNLVQQGNPIEAFQRDPASYSSDVAQLLFDGSFTAFLLFPNPVTAVIAGVAGVIWLGTEIWDHWDDITAGIENGVEWVGDRFTDVTNWAGGVADDVGDFASGVRDAAREIPVIGGLF